MKFIPPVKEKIIINTKNQNPRGLNFSVAPPIPSVISPQVAPLVPHVTPVITPTELPNLWLWMDATQSFMVTKSAIINYDFTGITSNLPVVGAITIRVPNPFSPGSYFTFGTYTPPPGCSDAQFLLGITEQIQLNPLGFGVRTSGLLFSLFAKTGLETNVNGLSLQFDHSGGGFGVGPFASTTLGDKLSDLSGTNNEMVSVGGFEFEKQNAAYGSFAAIKKSGVGTVIATAFNFPNVSIAGMAIYVVAKQLVTDPSYGAYCTVPDALSQQLFLCRGIGNDITGRVLSGGLDVTRSIPNDTFSSIRFRADTTTFYLAVNNGAESQQDRIGATYEAAKFCIMGNSANDFFYGDKQILEMIIYSVGHDEETRGKVENYINNKYNLY